MWRNTASIIIQYWLRDGLQLNPNSISEFGAQNIAPSSAGYYSTNTHVIKVKVGMFLVMWVHYKIFKNEWILLCSFIHNWSCETSTFFSKKGFQWTGKRSANTYAIDMKILKLVVESQY